MIQYSFRFISKTKILLKQEPSLNVLGMKFSTHNKHRYIDDIHEAFKNLTPNHKADYFRAHILGKRVFWGFYPNAQLPKNRFLVL
jgi:hypothetical protein